MGSRFFGNTPTQVLTLSHGLCEITLEKFKVGAGFQLVWTMTSNYRDLDKWVGPTSGKRYIFSERDLEQVWAELRRIIHSHCGDVGPLEADMLG